MKILILFYQQSGLNNLAILLKVLLLSLKKINNELKNIFLFDKGNNLKNLSSNQSSTSSAAIVAGSGIINENRMILFNGQIISSKTDSKSEIIKFEQLSIDLSNLSTTTIKEPKIQETSTFKLANCLLNKSLKNRICNENFKKKILPTLNRRLVIPFYIPILSLICSILLLKSKQNNLSKINVFLYSFSLLIFTELAVRYTGINNLIMIAFLIIPIILSLLIYLFLIIKFSKESSIHE